MSIRKDSSKWIAVYTKPRHEKIVAKDLERNGVKVYLPLMKERRKWSDRKKWVEFPLFKSYIFVSINSNNHLPIFETKGIVRIIKFGDSIATVRNNEIAGIKMMIDGGYNPISTDYFIKGDPVKVKDGPLRGIEGEVVRIDENDRLLLRINAIKHSVSVKVNIAYLTKL